MSDEIKLKYVGAGFLPGVPARDLTEAEVREHGGLRELKASGLYADVDAVDVVKEKPAAGSKKADKEGD